MATVQGLEPSLGGEAYAVSGVAAKGAGDSAPARISRWRILAFAMPAFQTGIVIGPLGTMLPTIYAREYGLSLALIGPALFIARLFDGAIDPAIGFFSDRTRSRLGRRKPWVLASALLMLLPIWFLYMPPAHPSLTYFLGWYLFAYFAWSLLEIPHAAWTLELTREPTERSRVITWRIGVAYAGTIMFLLLPFLPMFATTEFNAATIRVAGMVAFVVIPLSAIIGVIWGPKDLPVTRADQYGVRDLLTLFKGNRPLRPFAAGFLLNGFALGMFGGLAFLYFTSFLRMGAQYGLFALVQILAGWIGLSLVTPLVRRFERLKIWAVTLVITVVLMLSVLLLPHGPAAAGPLMLLGAFIAFFGNIGSVVVLGVFGDIVDYDTLKTGKKRAAMYTSLLTLFVKINAAVGAAAALWIVGLFGYNAEAGATNSDWANLGMQLTFIVIPTLIMGTAIVFIWLFPIDRRRQSIISRRLDQRERRAAAAMAAGEGALA